MEKTQVEAVCTVGILIKDSLKSYVNSILPVSPHVGKKVKILEFGIHQDSSLVFLLYSVFIAMAFSVSFPMWPLLLRTGTFWKLGLCKLCSDRDGSFQLHCEGTWWTGQMKDGCVQQRRQFCAALELESHLASAIKPPPGQATIHLHRVPMGSPVRTLSLCKRLYSCCWNKPLILWCRGPWIHCEKDGYRLLMRS